MLFCAAPGVVIYDNACRLATFCQLREPAFFQDTSFFVDRLHMYGIHTALCDHELRLLYACFLLSLLGRRTLVVLEGLI